LRVRIKGPQSLNGRVKAPGSKAYTHRALLAALLSPGESHINNTSQCDDTKRTLQAIKALGARVQIDRNRITTEGIRRPTTSNRPIDCGDSGTTLRFLTAISSLSPTTVRLTGSPQLGSRPLDPLVKAIKDLGASVRVFRNEQGLEVIVRGPLLGGETRIQGNITSQFVSGLLFASPLARKDVTINIDGPLESRPYVSVTIDVLKKHGIRIEESENQFRISAPQKFTSTNHTVPGDFSSMAFLIASVGTIGSEITITGLDPGSLEPDAAILKVLPQTGLEIEETRDKLTIRKRELEGFVFDARDNPDLVPPLEALGSLADGWSEIQGVRRLVYKESDRLHSVPMELAKMGAKIHVEDDRVKIEGGELTGSTLDSHHDHRVVMACAAASLGATGESTIDGAEVVSKSYPEFFQDLARLGARINVE
jgi:3-phosphoshikimate 1-carboxyvinyltransferase